MRAVVITGNERAFAAGADIKEMAEDSAVDMLLFDQFQKVGSDKAPQKARDRCRERLCLGGGCELAMLCDIIIASETAQFGQPEIKIG